MTIATSINKRNLNLIPLGAKLKQEVKRKLYFREFPGNFSGKSNIGIWVKTSESNEIQWKSICQVALNCWLISDHQRRQNVDTYLDYEQSRTSTRRRGKPSIMRVFVSWLGPSLTRRFSSKRYRWSSSICKSNVQEVYPTPVFEFTTMAGVDYQLVSERSQLELLSTEKAAKSVLISNISPKLRRDDIMIYFQKKRNGGGEVDDIFIIEDGKAVIVFDKPEGLISVKCILLPPWFIRFRSIGWLQFLTSGFLSAIWA